MQILQLLLVYHYVGEECLGGDTYIFVDNGSSIEKSIYNGDTASNWDTLISTKSPPLGIDVDIATCTLFYNLGNKNENLMLQRGMTHYFCHRNL